MILAFCMFMVFAYMKFNDNGDDETNPWKRFTLNIVYLEKNKIFRVFYFLVALLTVVCVRGLITTGNTYLVGPTLRILKHMLQELV